MFANVLRSVGWTALIIGLMASTVQASEKHKDEEIESSDRVPVSTGKYITGGVLGSILGFGIGHAVQGRWQQKGYIFTIGQSAGLLAFTTGFAQCLKDNSENTATDCSSSQKSLMLAGYGAMIGFHIWEIVDVWTGARPVSQESQASAMILPTANNGAQLTFNYVF